MTNTDFWHSLKRPFTVLAPMEDVTDRIFRDIVAEAGAPDVFYTEFARCGSILNGGREALRRLEFTQEHRPMVAQIWGNNPEEYRKTARELHLRGFDGIDINMGCPQKKITSKGSCSAMINTPALAAEIVQAAKEGAREAWQEMGDDHQGPGGKVQSGGPLPVSVKTRIGFSSVITEEWCGHLLDQEIPVLTVHGRTAAQQSEGSADWNEIARVVAMRDARGLPTLILGNGDIVEPGQIERYPSEYGVDGVMVGRGIFSNPLIFSGGDFHALPPATRLDWAAKHLEAYRKYYGARRNFEIMKKFFKIYVINFPQADEMRDKLMQTHSYQAASEMLDQLRSRMEF